LTSGTFVDAPVAGLNYSTSSDLSGVTDADGRYDYHVGDTVTFSIGNLVLGTVPGQGVVTPMTVANALVANTSNNPETVAVNLLVLLQSLDANGDPDDGITFTPAIRDAVAANSIRPHRLRQRIHFCADHVCQQRKRHFRCLADPRRS
jgi:para-nitrobenzyl esterase